MGLILCPFQAKFWLEMVLILGYIAPSWGSFYAPVEHKNGHFFDRFMLYTRQIWSI